MVVSSLQFPCNKNVTINICRVQEEQLLKDEEAEKVDAVRRHQHAEEVRQQVREKEKDRIKARNAFFEEGIKLDQEARAR